MARMVWLALGLVWRLGGVALRYGVVLDRRGVAHSVWGPSFTILLPSRAREARRHERDRAAGAVARLRWPIPFLI